MKINIFLWNRIIFFSINHVKLPKKFINEVWMGNALLMVFGHFWHKSLTKKNLVCFKLKINSVNQFCCKQNVLDSIIDLFFMLVKYCLYYMKILIEKYGLYFKISIQYAWSNKMSILSTYFATNKMYRI